MLEPLATYCPPISASFTLATLPTKVNGIVLADLVFKGTLVEGVYSGVEYWLEVLAVPRGPKTESAERPLL